MKYLLLIPLIIVSMIELAYGKNVNITDNQLIIICMVLPSILFAFVIALAIIIHLKIRQYKKSMTQVDYDPIIN